MGEVRVTARLTNAADEALVRHGMLAPDQVRSCHADALIDTGAVRMVTPPHIASGLGLGLRGQRMAEFADGRTEAVSVTEPLIVELEGRDTLEEALVLGDEVLIGQTRAREARPVRGLAGPTSCSQPSPPGSAGHEGQAGVAGRLIAPSRRGLRSAGR